MRYLRQYSRQTPYPKSLPLRYKTLTYRSSLFYERVIFHNIYYWIPGKTFVVITLSIIDILVIFRVA